MKRTVFPIDMIYDDNFIMSPKVDFAFKEIMTNEMVRKGFLSAVLDINADDVKSTVMLNTNLKKVHDDEKQGILDVRMTMNDDTELDIEIQLSYMKAWAERSIFYLAKMLVEQTDINKRYSNFKKCIGINILDFNYIKDIDRFHTSYHVREDTNYSIYTDVIECHVIELPKLPQSSDGTSLYDWVQFMKSERKEEFEMLAKKSIYLDEAYKQLEIISQDKQKRIEYTSRQKALYDYNTLMEERFDNGITVGREQGIESMIKKMRKSGMSEEQIQSILNL